MKTASVAKFRLGGQDFAVVPWGEYRRLTGKRARGVKSARDAVKKAAGAAALKRQFSESSKAGADLRRKRRPAHPVGGTRIRTPRLAHPEQAGDFVKQVVEMPDDARL